MKQEEIQLSEIRPIHPFPARMSPSIVWDILPPKGNPLRVLDPMAGSGTTLVSARAKGHQALGCDTDPLALLIAQAWCSDIFPEKLSQCANQVLSEAKRFAKGLSPKDAYPIKSDDETKMFIDFWFDNENKIQLTALSEYISRIHDDGERTLLWSAFSRLIITKKTGASLAMDVSHSRPHRKYDKAPIKPFNKFLKAVDYINKKAPFGIGRTSAAPAIIKQGDARVLPFDNDSIDMIITSPPYLNAIDYIRGHKLSLVWMGHSIKSLRTIRSDNIGSERSASQDNIEQLINIMNRMGSMEDLDKRNRSIIMRYLIDMDRAFSESRRVLRKRGQAIYVIGNSSIRGVYVKNSEALIGLAQKNGLDLLEQTTRPIPDSRRYLPPPSSKKSGLKMEKRMREEVVLRFAG